ncbi:hypothetical protein D3C77_430250 [compost metagenome]
MNIERYGIPFTIDRRIFDRRFGEIPFADSCSSSDIVQRLQLIFIYVSRYIIHVHDHEIRTFFRCTERNVKLLVVLSVRLNNEIDLVLILRRVIFIYDLLHERAVRSREWTPEQNIGFRLAFSA